MKNTTDNKNVENRKKLIKNARDLEKISKIMQQNGISELESDGVRIVINREPLVVPRETKSSKSNTHILDQFNDLNDDDIAEWSSQ